jgi:hypothetical protein
MRFRGSFEVRKHIARRVCEQVKRAFSWRILG